MTGGFPLANDTRRPPYLTWKPKGFLYIIRILFAPRPLTRDNRIFKMIVPLVGAASSRDNKM